MKIVVCVKQIQHIYARTGMDRATNFIAQEDIVNIINPLDELAVEEGIRLRDAHGGGEVIMLTLGELFAEGELRHCFAMGADRMIRIHDPSSDTGDAWSTGAILAAAIRKLSPDLVLCGKQALDDCCGQVGITIAGLLDYPCVGAVTRVELYPEKGQAMVHRALERGDREVIECVLPALFTVEKGLNEPRYPRLEDLLGAQEVNLELWDAGVLDLDPELMKPLTKVAKVYPPKPRTKKIKAPDRSLSAQERIKMLMGGGGGAAQQKQKESSKIIELPPRKAAQKVIDFLEDKKYL